jgi:hypothetical protein
MFMKFALALLATPSLLLNGTWHETYSNNYVQTTSQVDWKCVVVHVRVDDDGDMTLQKTASLHGGPINMTSPLVRTKLQGNTFATPTSFRSSVTYDVHPYDNRTVVITGEEVPAMYVWTRPPESDDEDDYDPVDVPRILAFAEKLGFHSSDRYYNEMVQTYDARSC